MLKTELGRLRKANQLLCKSFELKLEDHELLKQMLNYLAHKRLNPYDFETVRADILGMALEAKKRQEPLHELIGDDRAFCDSLTANCNKNRLSTFICEWLGLLLLLLSSTCLFNFVGLLFEGGIAIAINARQVYIGVFLWFVYFMLWMRVIPLPYSFFKHSEGLIFLVLFSWMVLYAIFARTATLNAVLFTINGYANLALLVFFGLGFLALRYAADTLAYKQSSFGGGETHVEN